MKNPDISSYLKKTQTIMQVDEKGSHIGPIDKWEAHKKGTLHKGFSVALFYRDQIILQIRKHVVFDTFIDVTASSHPLVIQGKMQDEIEAVYICLKREWYIKEPEITKLTNCGSIVYKAKDGAGYIEHEYCTFYAATIDRLPQPNSESAYGFIVADLSFVKQNLNLFNIAPWVKDGIALVK